MSKLRSRRRTVASPVERPVVVRLRPLFWLTAAALALTLMAHWPALSARARYFDDDSYISSFYMKYPSWATAGRVLVEVLHPTVIAGYYQPLSILSLMLDHALGGGDDNLFPFHLTSVLIHLTNTALVILLLYLLFGRVAAAVGLVFGLHPLTVEPVVWVAERKTLLAAFFALGALMAYVAYARRPARRRYAAALFLYILALLSKPTALPLPLLFLILDFWPLERWRRDAVAGGFWRAAPWPVVREKIPFLLLAAVAAAVAYLSQRNTAFITLPHQYPAGGVPLIICYNVVFYLLKFLWPVPLAPYYPFPQPLALTNPAVLGGVLGSAGLLAVLVLSLRWTRAFLAGWLFFFIAVFPALGIIGFTYTIAADRFAYLPMVGFLLPAAWLGQRLEEKMISWPWRPAALVILGVTAALEVAGVRGYLVHWQDPVEFYRYALRGAPMASVLLNNYGYALFEAGRQAEAAAYFQEAIRLEPDNPEAHYNLAWIYMQQGRLAEAGAHCREALRVRPAYAPALNILGLALYQQGHVDEALAYYRQALAVDPAYAEAHANLGVLLFQQGRLDEAIGEFEAAIRFQPDEAANYANLGTVLLKAGRLAEAVAAYRRALQMKPDDGLAHNNLGSVLMQLGQIPEALAEFQTAVRLDPQNPLRHLNLGRALEEAGRLEEAAAEYREVLRLDPANAEARRRLETLEAK